MRITVIGRGNVGGGLARLWEAAGHDVTRLGREGGDVSDADVVLLAVPGDAVAEALDGVPPMSRAFRSRLSRSRAGSGSTSNRAM